MRFVQALCTFGKRRDRMGSKRGAVHAQTRAVEKYVSPGEVVSFNELALRAFAMCEIAFGWTEVDESGSRFRLRVNPRPSARETPRRWGYYTGGPVQLLVLSARQTLHGYWQEPTGALAEPAEALREELPPS